MGLGMGPTRLSIAANVHSTMSHIHFTRGTAMERWRGDSMLGGSVPCIVNLWVQELNVLPSLPLQPCYLLLVKPPVLRV